eukprot:scpid57620/ scgid20652/ Prolactin regulatory element-binding protein; Mammalian guanine nucleotide exchange factor mSec12
MISTDYPLYSVVSLGNGRIAIAGGGGSSKTGVPNRLEVHHLSVKNSAVENELVCQLDTGRSAVMNCCVRHRHSGAGKTAMACGMDDHCALIDLEIAPHASAAAMSAASPGKSTARSRSASRDRRSGTPTSTSKSVAKRRAEYAHRGVDGDGNDARQAKLVVGAKKRSDTHERYALQKVARFCPSQDILATGGADGRIHVWQYPSLDPVRVMDRKHTDDIDDLAFHPSQPVIVSVSCDKTCYVWSLSDRKPLRELKFKFAGERKDQPYKFRSCRFLPSLASKSALSGRSADDTLVTTHSPVMVNKAPSSYVCLWAAHGPHSQWTQDRYVAIGNEPVSCLSCLTNQSGRFIGVGTLHGSVRILNDSLQTLMHVKELHSMYVTSVALISLPLNENCDVTTDIPAIVSVSDRTCRITHVSPGFKDVLLLVAVIVAIIAMFVYFVQNYL